MNAPTQSEPKASRACVGCAGKAKSVEPVTIRSLVREEALEGLSTSEGFRFCAAGDCGVAYSQAITGETIGVDDVSVEIFQKSKNPDRLVCYCFGHSVSDVEADATERAILADVEDKCRQGLDRCEIENPQGRCCLSNVREVYADSGTSVEASAGSGCCATKTESVAPPPTSERSASEGEGQKAGRWAAGGAVVAAVASSACCWLPLALISLGVSAGGVGVFFEAYRTWFLIGTTGLLGVGFYFVYLRKPKCAPGDACAVPNPRLTRLNKILLWTAAAFVVTFAAFPNYIGYLLGNGDDPVAVAADIPEAPRADEAAAATAVTRSYHVEGMSCPSCTVHVEETVGKLAGVTRVEVIYEQKLARVTFAAGADASDESVIAAIAETGYEATPKAP